MGLVFACLRFGLRLWQTRAGLPGLLLALCLGLAPSAQAHDVAGAQRVKAFVRADGDRVQMVVRIPLELLLNVDLPKRGNGYLDLAQMDTAFPRALAATTKGIELFASGERLTPTESIARIALPDDKAFASIDEALTAVREVRLAPDTSVYWNQGYFDALFIYPLAAANDTLAIDFHVAPGLRDRLTMSLRYVTPEAEVRAFELVTDAGRVSLDPRWYQAGASFVASGFRHILGGADHLLFLVCLIVPFRRVGWPLVGVVTAFTLGHSITLTAAAYGIVPSGDWFAPAVETMIALSILYLAVENLLGANLRRRWVLTGLFGLVHGFGFSFALANELQFAGSHLLLSLLAFNIGIEIGQVLVLVLLWPVLALVMRHFARSERVVVGIVSAVVAHSAWHWMSERLQALSEADLSVFEPGLLLRIAIFALLALAATLLGLAWRRRVRAPSGPVALPGAD